MTRPRTHSDLDDLLRRELMPVLARLARDHGVMVTAVCAVENSTTAQLLSSQQRGDIHIALQAAIEAHPDDGCDTYEDDARSTEEAEPVRNGTRPIHPGEVLREEFMQPMGLSASALARDLRVSPCQVTGLLNGQRTITVDAALRLARFFGTTPEYWMNLQSTYDLRSEEITIAKDIAREVAPAARA